MNESRRYIFVTGGVASALGKGITCASIGRMLKNRGYNVSIIKLDPYLNVDPGTMSPYEHGEVFVTDDGTETDLDLGHYERFLSKDLSRLSNVTAGQIYHELLRRERKGDEFLGETVQVVPHLVQAVARRIRNLGDDENADIVIVEVGGTVGDMEADAFIEAVRWMRQESGPGGSFSLHLAFVPLLKPTNELKTKPTQHSVRQLRSLGVQPDAILCRLNDPTDSDAETRSLKEKVSVHCGVDEEAIIYMPTLGNVYAVPAWLEAQGLGDVMLRTLQLDTRQPDVPEAWERIAATGMGENAIPVASQSPGRAHDDARAPLPTTAIANGAPTHVTEPPPTIEPPPKVKIAIVGKYTGLQDSYISVVESLRHSGIDHGVSVDLHWVGAEAIETDGATSHLKSMQGILVPGGFDQRGSEGMIAAAQFARENDVPFFGLCLGLQIMIIEFARHVLGISDATSREFDALAANPVIDLLPTQRDVSESGGTMRLGAYDCQLKPDTIAARAYAADTRETDVGDGSADGAEDAAPPPPPAPTLISERHRHRYEYNADYRDLLEGGGLVSSGVNPQLNLVEIAEIESHPFMLGSQFHPEFRSRPDRPHPLFNAFVGAAIACTPLEGQTQLLEPQFESAIASPA